jgi:predicted transcriptional regulator
MAPTLSVRLPDDLDRSLRLLAAVQKATRSEILVDLLRKATTPKAMEAAIQASPDKGYALMEATIRHLATVGRNGGGVNDLLARFTGEDKDVDPAGTSAPTLPYQVALANGSIKTAQLHGFSPTEIPAHETADLTIGSHSPLWITALTMNASNEAGLVTHIRIGLKWLNLPCGGMALSSFMDPADPPDIGWKFLTPEQTALVRVVNQSDETILVTGGFLADEVDPIFYAVVYEDWLLERLTMP